MSTIAQSVSPSVGFSLSEQGGSFAGLSALTRARAEQRTSAELSIVTNEGDRVTLTANAGSLSTYARYDSRGRLENSETTRSGEFRGSASQNQFQVTVEGDLNEAELADIRRILEVQGELFSGFLSGEISDEVSEVLDLDELGTIAKVDASLDIAQRVDVFQRIEAVGSGKEISDDHHGHGARGGLITFKGVDKLIDKLLDTVEKYADNPGKLARKLPKLIGKLFNKIANEHGKGSPKQRLGEAITSKFLEALGGTPSRESSNGVLNTSQKALPTELKNREPGPLRSRGDGHDAEHDDEDGQDSIRLTVERRFSREFHAHFSFSLERAPVEPEGDEIPDSPPTTPPPPTDPTNPGVEPPIIGPAPIDTGEVAEAPVATALLSKAPDAVKPNTTPSLSALLGRLQNTSAASIGAAVRANTATELLSSLSALQRPGAPVGGFSNIFDLLQQDNAARFARPNVSFFA